MQVFHGADMDIGWLQRDFGLYVVNMFDTGQASRVLGLERFSLAFLLKNYCNVIADKQYQLADWRLRQVAFLLRVMLSTYLFSLVKSESRISMQEYTLLASRLKC